MGYDWLGYAHELVVNHLNLDELEGLKNDSKIPFGIASSCFLASELKFVYHDHVELTP